MNQGNIDQIRDIIFGQQMADFRKEMEKMGKDLENMLTRFRDEANTALADLRKEANSANDSLDKKLQSVEADIRAHLDTLNNAQTRRSDLGAYLIELGQKLQDGLGEVAHKNGVAEE